MIPGVTACRVLNEATQMTTIAVQGPPGRNYGTLSPRTWLIAAALAALAVGVMFDAWRDILRIGMFDEEFSYVLLAPIAIGWLVLGRWNRLKDCPVRHGWVGLGVMLLGWSVFWYGYHADPVLWRTGAVITAVGAVMAAVGFNVTWRLLPAFAATAFLIPIAPNGRYRLAEPLQVATAQATQGLCDLLGIEVQRAGMMLMINGVDVTVAEACNGMRMVLTLFLVCYAVVFTTPLRPWLRILLLVLTPLVAIAANVIRLVPTMWMFGHRPIETAERFHDLSGWVMTILAFLGLMAFARLLKWLTEPAAEPPRPRAG
jgi:exosortase